MMTAILFLHILFHIPISSYYEKFCNYLMTFSTLNLSLFKISLAFLMKGVTLIISLYLKILNGNPIWKFFFNLSSIDQTVSEKSISRI